MNAVYSLFTFRRSLPGTTEAKEPSIMMQSLSQVSLVEDDEKSRKNLSTYTYEDLCIACTKVINKECTGAAAMAAYLPLRLRRVKVRNAKGPTRTEADQWFAFLRATLTDIGILVEGRSQEWMRSRINIDETGAERLDAKHLRVVVPPHKEG